MLEAVAYRLRGAGRAGRANFCDVVRSDPQLNAYQKIMMMRIFRRLCPHVHWQGAVGRCTTQQDLANELSMLRADREWIEEHVAHLVADPRGFNTEARPPEYVLAATRLAEACTVLLRALTMAGAPVPRSQLGVALMCEEGLAADEPGGTRALLGRALARLVADQLVTLHSWNGGAQRVVLEGGAGRDVAGCDPETAEHRRRFAVGAGEGGFGYGGGGGGRRYGPRRAARLPLWA
ncbi:MAG: hypothetical protein J3K34DRAFT_434146 [Monoraphidium minutum]|nr:MAG: hypothetical protein J3K34DRAFT_434146 [Monoraphidium minutum]